MCKVSVVVLAFAMVFVGFYCLGQSPAQTPSPKNNPKVIVSTPSGSRRSVQPARFTGPPVRAKGASFMALSPSPPVFPVEVDPNLSLDANTQALFQQMATLLSGNPAVPNNRTNFYSAVIATAGLTVNNWEGWVENVQAMNGGNLVTVAVFPSLSSTDYGDSLAIDTNYYEQYFVLNGSHTYSGFLDPLNESGLPLGPTFGY